MTAGIGIAGLPLADSPLGRTVAHTATDIWNDSCAIDELEYALSFGAVGATANPTIVVDVWNKDPGFWRQRVAELALDRPDASVSDLAWAVVEDMSIKGARLLEPVFEAHAGRQGRLSVQTEPDAVPVASADGRPGRPVLGHRAQRHREVAGHDRGDRSDRGGDVPRGQRQRHGQLHRGPGDRRSRCHRTRPAPARRRGSGHAAHGSRGHAHDGARRGLAARGRRPGRAHDRSRRTAVERCCRVQAGLRGVPDARIPGAPAGRGDPAPLPLVGADRGRCRPHASGLLAAPVQCLGRGGPAADRRPGAARVPVAAAAPRRVREGVRAGWARASTRSTPTAQPLGRCARSSPRTRNCSRT